MNINDVVQQQIDAAEARRRAERDRRAALRAPRAAGVQARERMSSLSALRPVRKVISWMGLAVRWLWAPSQTSSANGTRQPTWTRTRKVISNA